MDLSSTAFIKKLSSSFIMAGGNSAIGKIILFSVIFLIVGGVIGYFIGHHSSYNGNFRSGAPNSYYNNSNFQINETTQADIKSFFDNTQDSQAITAYCQNNPRYCMYYCRTINPSDSRCQDLMANIRGSGTPSGA